MPTSSADPDNDEDDEDEDDEDKGNDDPDKMRPVQKCRPPEQVPCPKGLGTKILICEGMGLANSARNLERYNAILVRKATDRIPAYTFQTSEQSETLPWHHVCDGIVPGVRSPMVRKQISMQW